MAMPAIEALWRWPLVVGKVEEPFADESIGADVGGAAVVVAEKVEEWVAEVMSVDGVVGVGEDVRGVVSGNMDVADVDSDCCDVVCEVEVGVEDVAAVADVEITEADDVATADVETPSALVVDSCGRVILSI